MEHDEILKPVGKYKFTLAFENAIRTDYIAKNFGVHSKLELFPLSMNEIDFKYHI